MKEMQNLISIMKRAVKFNISSTIIVLLQFKTKLKKTQHFETGELDEKSAQNKKDVEFDFTSDVFHKIFCILNRIIFIIGIDFPKIQL